MAFASSLFCFSKFLEHIHTLTQRLTVLACSDNTKDVRFRFLAHFTLMLDFFLKSKYWFGDIKGGAKKKTQCMFFFFFFLFFCGWCFFPPLRVAPRRALLPPLR